MNIGNSQLILRHIIILGHVNYMYSESVFLFESNNV